MESTIKSYTDLEQSKKLAEILPLESADMRYQARYDNKNNLTYTPRFTSTIIPLRVDIPCWSLTALLGILPLHIIVGNKRYTFSMIKGLNKNGETYAIKYWNTTLYLHLTDFYNGPIDACMEMILKLIELNILKYK